MKWKLPWKKKKRRRSATSNAVFFRESVVKNRSKRKRGGLKKKFQPKLPVRLDVITKKRRSIVTLLVVLLVGAGGTVVFLTNFFHIDDVVVRRSDIYVNSVAIAKALEGIKGKHMLFLDTGAMERVIYDKFPEIKEVRVHKLFPRTLRVDLQSFDVLARIKNQEGSEFFLNEAGVAVKQDNEQNELPLIEIPTYRSVPEEEQEVFEELSLVKEYKQMMSQEQLYFILETRRLFEDAFHIPVTSIAYLPIEDEVQLRTERGFMVWVSIREERIEDGEFGEDKEYIEEQIDKLRQVLSELNIYKAELAYIDLRINDKVIYCETGAECADVPSRLQ